MSHGLLLSSIGIAAPRVDRTPTWAAYRYGHVASCADGTVKCKGRKAIENLYLWESSSLNANRRAPSKPAPCVIVVFFNSFTTPVEQSPSNTTPILVPPWTTDVVWLVNDNVDCSQTLVMERLPPPIPPS